MARDSDTRRYLIVGPGRSGSSLLAAVLVDAGADFDMPPIQSWNPGGGAYEHTLLLAARRWQSRMEKIRDSLIPDRLGRTYCQRRMLRDLKTLLDKATFVKSSDLVWLVQPVYRLGYTPQMIVSYRGFAAYARSHFLKRGMMLPELVARYTEVYATAALQVQVFGGCVMDFDDLVNPQETAWAEALSGVTGIGREALLAAREARVKPRAPQPDTLALPVAMDAIDRVHATFSQLKGRVIVPE